MNIYTIKWFSHLLLALIFQFPSSLLYRFWGNRSILGLFADPVYNTEYSAPLETKWRRKTVERYKHLHIEMVFEVAQERRVLVNWMLIRWSNRRDKSTSLCDLINCYLVKIYDVRNILTLIDCISQSVVFFFKKNQIWNWILWPLQINYYIKSMKISQLFLSCVNRNDKKKKKDFQICIKYWCWFRS